MAQSLFAALREADPNTWIDVVAPPWSLPLLRRMPEVNTGIPAPAEHGRLALATRLGLGKQLRSGKYSQAIVIPRSWKAALVPFGAKIPVRTGFLGEFRYLLLNDIRNLDRSVLQTTVERFTALGLPAQASMPPKIRQPRLRVDADNARALIRKFGLDCERPIAGLMPGAEYGPAKQWPTPHFADLARLFTNEGWQVWLFGSTKDHAAAEEIINLCPRSTVNLCGRTSLEDAVDLIAQTDVAVSNDSGLMHVAAAVGTRVAAIFGSSSPEYTPPLSAKAQVLTSDIECRPCFQRRCRFGHYRCLTEIDPHAVFSRIC